MVSEFRTSLRELINIPEEARSQVGDWASLLDDRIIVSGASGGTYHFWDVFAPGDLTAQGWERVIHDADRWQGDPQVCNKMHNRVAYRSEGSILVDEKPSNNRVASLNVGPRLRDDLELSSRGKHVSFRLAGSYDRYLWSIDTQTVFRLGHSPRNHVQDSPDGHYIVIQRERDFAIWDTRTGTLVSILDLGNGKWSFSPDGRYIAAAGSSEVKLWDMNVALLSGPYRSNHPVNIRNGIFDFSQ